MAANIFLTLLYINEPRFEKKQRSGFRHGPKQTRLYSYRRWVEA